VAFVHADLPKAGTAGTGLDEPCTMQHHGIVIRGSLIADFEDGRRETFDAGTAFYVPAGPSHRFATEGATIVAGFAPLTGTEDIDPATLAARGFEVLDRTSPAAIPPATIKIHGRVAPYRRKGAVETEGAIMGSWLLTRATLGPSSAYTSTWCELPHWGVVLDGDMAITYRDDVELVSRGDAYYAPAGHRFETADGATFIDYTPLDELDGRHPIPLYRRTLVDRLVAADARSAARIVPDAPAQPEQRSLAVRPLRALPVV
jgi:mannose-6-phosphate isomerase-like protein (cupin superfamily)